jgi:ArsR family transcriptional regulator, arsenate/arsenite/antimonite-responsive transcriptional repressor
MSLAEAEVTAALFKALADPARVRIVNMLATADTDVCVCDLTPELGLAQPTVSHHLRKLADAGLLRRRQQGTWAYYSLDRDALAQLESVTRFSIGGKEVDHGS